MNFYEMTSLFLSLALKDYAAEVSRNANLMLWLASPLTSVSEPCKDQPSE
jgi:hypothetical protein